MAAKQASRYMLNRRAPIEFESMFVKQIDIVERHPRIECAHGRSNRRDVRLGIARTADDQTHGIPLREGEGGGVHRRRRVGFEAEASNVAGDADDGVSSSPKLWMTTVLPSASSPGQYRRARSSLTIVTRRAGLPSVGLSAGSKSRPRSGMPSVLKKPGLTLRQVADACAPSGSVFPGIVSSVLVPAVVSGTPLDVATASTPGSAAIAGSRFS